MLNSIRHVSLFFTGGSDRFSMEHRAFNMISGITVVMFSYAVALYLSLGYQKVAIWVGHMAAISLILFYLSRFKRQFKFASTTFVILSYLLLATSYFINSGVSGPTVYLFLMTLIVNIVITPRRHHPIWVGLHMLIVPLLFLAQARFPELVQMRFEGMSALLLEHSLAYIPCIGFLGALAIYLTTAYRDERQSIDLIRKELEEKNKELEFSNKEKDRLFGIIAHDLRGPLGSIRSYLEMLDVDQLEPEERNFLNQQLLGLTKGTTDLLNNLLNWSVHKVWQEDTELRSLPLKPHVDEVINLLKPEAIRKQIELQTELEDNDIQLMADSEMLHLVLRNLLSNAIKFSKPNTSVRVKARMDGAQVKICIVDQGLGIPKAQQTAIFGSQVKPALGTGSEKGVGLGLVLCHDFVKTMQGSIAFQSEENKGTEFTISFQKGLVEQPVDSHPLQTAS